MDKVGQVLSTLVQQQVTRVSVVSSRVAVGS